MRRSLALVAALALVVPQVASAADQIKPLRTLVYTVVYTTQQRDAEQTSGFTGQGGGPGTAGGMATRTSSADDDGSLTVNVVAATPDGGLVVDTSYAGKTTQQPLLRVAIFPDGRLSVPPNATLSAAAAYVLPLLARGTVANRTLEAGATWSRPAAPPAKGVTTFRVTSIDGQNATLEIGGSITMPGARGYDETTKGTAVYDTEKLAPVSYDLVSTSRHTLMDQYITSSAHLTATLVSDTFGAK
jgi:hypothetical protein